MSDPSRRVWTMVGLVVRIARAMGLDRKTSGRFTPFEVEIRRRTWHYIRFFDVFAAMDRATEPIIKEGSYDTPLPHNVNDSEFDEHSTSVPDHHGSITDMGFALLAFEAVRATQRLAIPEYRATGDTWQQRLDFAKHFREEMQERFFQYCDPSVPFHWLIKTIGVSMSKGMVLRAIRPVQKHVSSTPPRIDTPYVLQTAVEALEENEKIYTNSAFKQYRWLVWVQWHSLAVILAGLCSIRGTELADQAWACIDRTYERQAAYVADARGGMLWRPIERLYRKALAFREAGRRESAPPQTQNSPHNHRVPQRNATYPALPSTLPPASDATMLSNAYVPSAGSHHTNVPIGGMPMNGALTNSMDFNLNPMSAGSGLTPLAGGDMSWLDWEGIMHDINTTDITGMNGVPLNMDDLQTSPTMQSGPGWSSNLNPDLM
jgi:hypothetical protein